MLAQSRMQWLVGFPAVSLELSAPFPMASMLLPMASLEVKQMCLIRIIWVQIISIL